MLYLWLLVKTSDIILKITNKTLVIAGIIISVVIGIIAGGTISFLKDLPQVADLRENKPNLSTRIFDCNDELIDQLYVEQRTLIPLNKVPEIFQKAIIAVEDEKFFSHFGIDPIGITRALFINILHGRIVQGGSTITQQLARNLFLTRKRTFIRKIKEVLLALEIERKYTKKEILEMYLNQIYFGSGAYGIEAAARTYFGKHVWELTTAECAILSGLPRAPNEYSPYKNLDKAVKRKNSVLSRLFSRGIISKEEFLKSKKESVNLRKIEIENAPYFVEYIRQKLEETYGSNVIYKGGLNVYTTLDLKIQNIAERILISGIESAEKELLQKTDKKLQGAMLVLDTSGNIKAMVGGRSFKESEFNRAVQARRQPGSAFKPFIYLTAIEVGFTPADIIVDSPVVFKDSFGNEWKPENYERKFFGPTTLRNAITHSRNVVTVKLLAKLGVDNVINYTHRVGIKSELTKDLTLALGTSEVTLLELVGSFTVFPNMGLLAEPIAIKSIKDSKGVTIEEYNTNIEEVIKPETAYILTSMMESVINNGTARVARRFKIPKTVAGKTGTTDNNTDAWFIGFTPEIIAGVWLGYDDKISLGDLATAAKIAVPIWASFISEVYDKDKETKNFEIPENIVTAKIDTTSGLLATKDCKETVDEVFINGTVPTKPCDTHTQKLPF